MCKHSVSDNGQPVFSPLPDTSSAAGGGADSGIGLSPQVGSREATSAGAASSSSQSSSATSSSQSPHPQQSSFTTDSGNDSLHTNTSTGNQSLESITSIPGTKKDARRYRHLALKVVARRPLGVQEGLILRDAASSVKREAGENLRRSILCEAPRVLHTLAFAVASKLALSDFL